ncbi:MAG: glycoside hydrolase family 71/99 protein, partial [Myxococcaceae bacterium]
MDRMLAIRLPGLFAAAALAAACTPGLVEFQEGGPDAGEDGGVPTGEDSGSPDSGFDSGVPDSGAADSGAGDSGRPDAGFDGGGADAGVDARSPLVDATTLTNKLLFGYQGWFLCPGDGAPPNRWVHWFGGSGNPTFDMYPDTSELGAAEKCPTSYSQPDGGPAPVYSAWRQPTVVRHFQWMKQYGIDGVMLQRFNSELGDPAFFAFRNQVLQNVRAGAEQHGRVFSVMYDVSGANAATLVA